MIDKVYMETANQEEEGTDRRETSITDEITGLRELCSKFLSLFYSEFPLKSLHYAHFYSYYAYIYSFCFTLLAI